MGILEPLALISLPLLGAIVALYLLRFRRPTAPVASLRLWDVLTRDREANTLWQRLQVSVLLLLQVLALLALIMALARPWTPSARVGASNVILVMDVSASMGATDADDSGQTRLQAAQRRARQIVDDMPQESKAVLIAGDSHASIIVPSTDDKARLRSAIDALRPNAATTDLSEALRVAEASAAGKGSSVVWVLSDGAFPPLATSGGGTEEYRFYAVGKSEANQGITAMSLRQDEGVLSLFVQVANSASLTVTRRLDLALDEAPWNARTLDVGPGATQEIIIPDVPIGARVVEASLAGHDVLTLDDRAWAVNRASVPANVLLVTPGSRFLEAALSLLPTVTLYKTTPQTYTSTATINGGPFDLTVFDTTVPTETITILPEGNLLFMGLPASNPLFSVTGVITDPLPLVSQSFDPALPSQDSSYSPREPLLRYVDAGSLTIARASLVASPSWARQVLGSDKGPLIFAGETSGRKVVALTFPLKDSDLALQTAFPLLMRNLVTYLLPDPAAGLPASIAPFTTVGLEAISPAVDRVLVEDPEGREHTFQLSPEQPRAPFADTGLAGVYYVTQYAGDTIAAQEAFTVNLFSRDESSTPVNPAPRLPQGASAQPGTGAAAEQPTRQEFWPLVALAGIALLLLEWLYAQRMAVRRAITESRARRALRKAGIERG